MLYNDPDAIRKARYEAHGYVLYFDAGDEDGTEEDGFNVFEERWSRQHGRSRVFLMEGQTGRALLELLGGWLSTGYGVALRDVAEQAVYDFIHAGEDRQAALSTAAEGMLDDYSDKYVAGHPEQDPYFGLNAALTTRTGEGRTAGPREDAQESPAADRREEEDDMVALQDRPTTQEEEVSQAAAEPGGAGVSLDRIGRVRHGNGGATVLLYLDISEEEYRAAGEPWRTLTAAVAPGWSSVLFRMLLAALASEGPAADVVELRDEAERAVSQFLSAGVDRQALMAPLMEALSTDTHHGRSNEEDPMSGYMLRAQELDEASERRQEELRQERRQERLDDEADE